MDRPFIFAALSLAAIALTGAGCGGLQERLNGVIVTALPSEVIPCRSVGNVATYSREWTRDDGLDQLREQALSDGGNTVLVSSYAISTTGKAYFCDPPLNPDGHPWRGGPVEPAKPASAPPAP